GFGVFSDKETLSLIRRLAEKRGVVILTDSDGAGFLIRNRLKGALRGENVKHAYIPEIKGRERRKKVPSREGTLGVEGMSPEIIVEALRRSGAVFVGEEEREISGDLTKADLYALGLSGSAGSAEKRAALLRRLGLPEKLSANALLEVLNALYTREELTDALGYPR
ncbi:MAG: DUF4093 domain-containing protein, partial [Oscillospiraceae bacterium]|nr:DUF4093 domain-containing protein [Oscillospiraceae bacterium]